ncbi:hypothetical protein G6F57_015689 [Rhizopus arrhizus]|nr:hypothetical protein G6F57_015689 [Rhizopus arrhizus]
MQRLRHEELGQAADLSGRQQFGKPDGAAQHIAAGARRDHDVVGRLEAKVFPHLVRNGLRPLQEERLPVVAGVEDVTRGADGFGLRVFARAFHQAHVGAARADLRHLGDGRVGGRENGDAHFRRCAESRDGRAAVTRTVFSNGPNANLAQP